MKLFLIWKDMGKLILDAQSFVSDGSFGYISVDQTIEKRANLRERLHDLSDRIDKLYNAKVSKYATFGIAVWLDEICVEPYEQASHPWPTLQQELYATDDGGITLYEYIDEVLTNPFYPKFIYELYLCLLKGGFKGKYALESERHHIRTYITRLEDVLAFGQEKQQNEVDPAESITDELITDEPVTLPRYKIIFDKTGRMINHHFGLSLISGVVLVYLFFGLVMYW